MVKKEVTFSGNLVITVDEDGFYRANFFQGGDMKNPVVLGRFAGAPEFVKDALDEL